MPHRRSGRIAVTVVFAASAFAVAYVGTGAARRAESARPARASRVASPAAPTRKRTMTYRIAFFGDSVSAAAGASDRRHGYIAHVARWLRMRGNRVVTTVNAKGGVPVAYWEYAAMPRKLNGAVVELGTNDVRLGTPAAQFMQQYRTLTNRIRAANPKAQVLCLSVWSHPAGASVDGIINARIRTICPGTYVDITRLRARSHIRSSDGFHPNDVGYRLIARAVESKLKT